MRCRIKHLSDNPILLFDGVCNLCNGVVRFVIGRDPKGKFLFAALQSDAGQAFLRRFHLSTGDFETFVLVEKGRHYTQSTAALRVAKGLSGLWPLLYAFIIVPKPIRDFFYAIVARNRYRWFGRREVCMIPTEGLAKRFL